MIYQIVSSVGQILYLNIFFSYLPFPHKTDAHLRLSLCLLMNMWGTSK